MKIAVVYNRDSQAVINLFGQQNQEKIGLAVIRSIEDALRAGGHQSLAVEGDKDLISKLEDFMPRVVKGERPGMVFNVSYGIQGQARYTHVPSILEMVGIPYVASGPLAHSIALDKVVTKMVLVQHGLPTPGFAVLMEPGFDIPDLAYPLIVKPKNEAVSFGIKVVNSDDELRAAADVIFERFQQPVLVEQFVEGREVNVGLLGNGPAEALPPVELDFAGGPTVYSLDDKRGKSGREVTLRCPADLGPELTERAQDLARKTFAAVGCADCARVDFRLDAAGQFHILEINSLPAMGPRGSYVRAAKEAGLEFPDLVNRLVEVASARYFGTPQPPTIGPGTEDTPTAIFSFLTQRRDRLERRLREWTSRPSRTHDPIGLQHAVRLLSKTCTELGLRPVEDLTDERSVHTWQTRAGLDGGTLLVTHLDVPLAESMPVQAFRRGPEWLLGDGVATSRGPLVVAEYALRAVRHLRLLAKRRIGLLTYLDEGNDARYSRDLLRKAMGRASRVIVLRPGGVGGHVYSQRRGQRRYRLQIEGKPRRPGRRMRAPEPLVWAAQKVVEVTALTSAVQSGAVSVSDLRTESFPMLLPHRVVGTLLMTYRDADLADQLEASIRECLGSRGPKWELERVSERPPLGDRRASRRLLDELRRAAESWEIPVKGESSAWPSVAGLAPAETAVLCGLGPEATHLYTPDEAVERTSLLQRTLMLASLLSASDGAE